MVLINTFTDPIQKNRMEGMRIKTNPNGEKSLTIPTIEAIEL